MTTTPKQERLNAEASRERKKRRQREIIRRRINAIPPITLQECESK